MTTSVTPALCVVLPLVATIVSGYDPVDVVDPAATFSVEDPDPVTELGVKVAVAPAGTPFALRLTTPLNPFTAVTVAV